MFQYNYKETKQQNKLVTFSLQVNYMDKVTTAAGEASGGFCG
jgi:hypothetical protein